MFNVIMYRKIFNTSSECELNIAFFVALFPQREIQIVCDVFVLVLTYLVAAPFVLATLVFDNEIARYVFICCYLCFDRLLYYKNRKIYVLFCVINLLFVFSWEKVERFYIRYIKPNIDVIIAIIIGGIIGVCVRMSLTANQTDHTPDFITQSDKEIAACERLFYDDKTKASRKKKKVKTVDINDIFNGTGLIFNERYYGKIKLPMFLTKVTYEQIPAMLGSLIYKRKDYKPKTPEESIEQKEFTRKLNLVRLHWQTHEGDVLLKEFLVEVYKHEEKKRIIAPTYKTYKHHNYKPHAKIYLNDFNEEHFKPNKKGKVVLSRVDDKGGKYYEYQTFFSKFIQEASVKNKFLHYPKINAMLRTMIHDVNKENIKTKEEILEVFKYKCYVWNSKQTIDERDFKKLSWLLPYLPPKFMMINVEDHKAFSDIFRDMVVRLRDRITKYVTNYCDISLMSHHERQEWKKQQKQMFIEVMRSQDVQQKFLEGWTKEEIINYVYDHNAHIFQEKSHDLSAQCKQVKGKRETKQKFIRVSRDEKFKRNNAYDDFDCQSNPNVTFNSKVYSFFFLFFSFWRAVLTFKMVYYVFNVIMKYTSLMKAFFTCYQFKEALSTNIDLATERCRGILEEWRLMIRNPDTHPIPAETKNLLIEIKSFIHMIYFLIKNDKMNACAWASNIMFTRPELIVKTIKCFDFRPKKNNNTACYVHIIIGGKKRKFTERQYFDYVDAGVVPDEEQAPFVTETLPDFGESIVNIFARFLTSAKMYTMSDEDIKIANRSYAYMNYKTRDNKSMMETCKTIISLIGRTIFSIDPFDQGFLDYTATVNKFIFEADTYINITDDNHGKPSFVQEVVRIHGEGLNLKNNPLFGQIPSFLVNNFMMRFKQIEPLHTKVIGIFLGNEERIEPLCMLMTGPPGVGKTGTFRYIAKSIVRVEHFKDAKNPQEFDSSMLYAFNAADNFWSNYRKQKFFIMDDIFKVEDREINAEEAGIVIDVVNTATMSLNMPDLADKGRMCFNSEYVCITTNLANQGFEHTEWKVGLRDPTALTRRFHLVLHREEKTEKDAAFNKFRVDVCLFRPEHVGRVLYGMELVALIMSCREIQKEQDFKNLYTKDYLDAQIMRHKHLFDIPEKHSSLKICEKSRADYTLSEIEQEIMFENQRLRDDAILLKGIMRDTFKKESKISRVNGYVTVNGASPEEILIDMIRLKIYDWWNDPNVNLYIGACVILVALAFAVPIYFFFFPNEKPPELDAESKDRKMRNGRPPKAKTMHKMQTFTRVNKLANGVSFHTESKDSFYRSLTSKVYKAVMLFGGKVVRPDGSSMSDVSRGFHLKNNWMVVPAHFLLKFKDEPGCKLWIRYGNKKYSFEYPDVGFIVDEQDMMIFKITDVDGDVHFDTPPEMFKHLIKEADIVEIEQGHPMKLVCIDEDCNPDVRHMSRSDPLPQVRYPTHDEEAIIDYPLTYYQHTTFGESGSVLAIEGLAGKVQIIGMHVGRSTAKDVGCAVMISQEFFSRFMDESCFKTESSCSEFPHKVSYTVSSQEAYFYPIRSKFKKTKMFECFGPVNFIPAHLNKFFDGEKEIDPYMLGTRKLHQHFTHVEPITDDVMDYLFYLYPKQESRLLTFEEALNGSCVDGITSICLSTSAGYPWCLKNTKGKIPFIQLIDNKYYAYQPEFLEHLEHLDTELRLGNQQNFIFIDLLKSETRPIKKVQAGKTRLMAACPIDFLMLVRRYFLVFVTYVQSLCVSKPVAVGINVQSLDWTSLYHRLSRTAESVIAGDFENYDGKVPMVVTEYVCQFINKWYDDGEVNQRVRSLLFEHIYAATRLYQDKVYQVCDGNPSGQPLTSIVNSFTNIIMSYIILTYDFGCVVDDFEMTVYGDDNVITVNKPNILCSDFTPHFLRRFDINYTHFSKGLFTGVDKLTSIRFLQRAFVRDHSRYLAPLPMDDIDNIVYWYEGNVEHDLAMRERVRSYFEEMFHHGREKYNERTEEFLRLVKERMGKVQYEIISNMRKPWYDYLRAHYIKDSERFEDVFDTQSSSEDYKFNAIFKPEENMTTSRHVEFTERAVNEPSITHQDQLGSYNDVAPTNETNVNSEEIQDVYKSCNMETFNLDSVLEREYPIGNYSWLSTQGTNSTIAEMNFPGVLFTQPFIADKIADFHLFRAGIEITVRIVSNKFTYGKIMVFWMPNPNIYSAPNLFYTYNLGSGFPHLLCSAAAGEAVTFKVPFINNKRALNIQQYQGGEMGRFVFMVVNPLNDVTTAVPTAKIFVTARFIEPQLFLPFTAQSKVVNREADAKSRQGTISGALDTVNDFVSAISVVPAIAPYANLFTRVSKPAASMFSRLGLSKPTTLAMTEVGKINPYIDLNYGKGLDLAPKIAMDPSNGISTMPNVGGISIDEMDLKVITGTPQMVSLVTLTPTSNNVVVGEMYPDKNCYSDQITNLFRYYSGSYKYKLYITASLFHSVRLVFWINNATSTHWENCYHKIVDVQGDTEVEMLLPWMKASLMELSSTSGPGGNQLLCSVLSWGQPDDTLTCSIYLNVYKAANSDFQWGELRDCDFRWQSNPRADFSKIFEPIHPSIKGYSHEKLVCGEQYTTLREVIHKYHAYNKQTILTNEDHTYNRLGEGVSPNKRSFGIEMIGQFYSFWRGSIRMKMLSKTAIPNALIFYNDSVAPRDTLTGASITSTTNPVLEAEVPYYYLELFRTTRDGPITTYGIIQDESIRWKVSNLANQDYFMMKAAGDDFSFHFISPPLGYIEQIYPGDGVNGFSGLWSYYENAI